MGSDDKIWTIEMNTASENVPILLLHGFGAGVGFWILNLDAFAADRPLYAIDLLGYGKSSRCRFSKDAKEIEDQYVETIEKWRQKLNIEKMIILGHSFGGFLSTAYAIKYPERIEHVILGDPWGFTPAPDLKQYSLWKRSVIRVSGIISPLWIVRAAGPVMGPVILRKGRPDIVEKYENIVEKHDRTIAKYVYHCNTKETTGELAFRYLLDVGAYPKRPMGERMLTGLKENIPVTIIFGAESWIDNSYGPVIKEGRGVNCYTHIENIAAGHQLFSDNAEEFNRIVLEACKVLKSRNN